MTIRQISVLALLMVSGFLVVGQFYIAIPLVADVADRFETSPSNATFVTSAFGFAYAAGLLLFATLPDRHGPRRVIVLGLMTTALATALVGLASSLVPLLVARVIQGLAASTFPPAGLSLMAGELPLRHRLLGVSLMSFAFLGAGPLAQLFAAQAPGGLTSIMLKVAPLYLLSAVGLWFAANRSDTPQSPPRATQRTQLALLLRDRGMLAAWAAAATVLLGFVFFHTAAQAVSADIAVDAQKLRLIGLPPLLLTFAAAPLSARLGAPFTARLGLLLTAFSLVLGAAGTSTSFILATVLLSSGIAFAIPGLITIVAGRSPDANRGQALAFYTFALFFGASIAPPITLWLTQTGGNLFWVFPGTVLVLAAFGLTVTQKLKTSV
ncbi:MAG: MFS transporter [Mesorhizobium sp.]|uniref:MFS transporter n=1 Tax=Mesorhizobium sp. TaxID=1871066 RepID=UPI000FE82069|nr:MFS transporter [Mesorhizobium sp.]RWI50293.1 MAG: MFS transporter [Mesorhizobium sp.]